MEEKAGNGVRKPHYATEFTTLSGFGLKMLQKYGWKEYEIIYVSKKISEVKALVKNVQGEQI
jgi:hypothetical protein